MVAVHCLLASPIPSFSLNIAQLRSSNRQDRCCNPLWPQSGGHVCHGGSLAFPFRTRLIKARILNLKPMVRLHQRTTRDSNINNISSSIHAILTPKTRLPRHPVFLVRRGTRRFYATGLNRLPHLLPVRKPVRHRTSLDPADCARKNHSRSHRCRRKRPKLPSRVQCPRRLLSSLMPFFHR